MSVVLPGTAPARRGVGALLLGAGLLAAFPAAARDNIHIVGSSTVYPFITVVAERFGRGEFKTPIIEATGSGGGMKLFCSGLGEAYPDFTNASRRIKRSEFERCRAGGVTDIVEIKIGYDGIVLATGLATAPLPLTRRDLFLALAQRVPDPAGGESLVPNPYTTWAEVNPQLPARPIEVIGPPPTSGTRDAFVELAMEGGCAQIPWIAAMKATATDDYHDLCHRIREDGAFVEAGENDNLIVQKLRRNPNALGITGFSFVDQNEDVVHGSPVEGVAPTFEAIADGAYPISRPLYVYAKGAHVSLIPGMAAFIAALTDEATVGDEGYLTDRGLIPMPAAEREQFRAAAQAGRAMEWVE